MKKGIYAILAALTVFALAMTGCPTPDEKEPEKWTVTFDADGGDITGISGTTKTVIKGQAIGTLPGAEKDGYDFAGWFEVDAQGIIATNAIAKGSNYKPAGNVTLKAKWDTAVANTDWRVRFDADGGTISISGITGGVSYIDVPQGDSIATLPTATRGNDTFLGWFEIGANGGLGSTAITVPYTPSASIVVKAKWTQSSGTGPVVTTIPPQADNTVRFLYYGTGFVLDNVPYGGYYDFEGVEASETTWNYVLATMPKAKRTDSKPGFAFGYWQDQTNKKWDGATVIEAAKLTVTAKFWDMDFPAAAKSVALDKAWLGNTQFAVYEFDISEKDYTTITAISADFMTNEASLNLQSTPRPIRAMGPYFYSETPIPGPDGWNYFGDFVPDANGAYAAKFNSNGNLGWTDFNKFHPYLLSNTGASWATLRGSSTTSGDANGTQVVANEWFNVKVPTSGYSWNSGTNSPARVKGFIEADTNHEVQSASTVYTKVYFGFGIANAKDFDTDNKGWTAKEEDAIATLVKNVTIYFGDNSTVTGTIPAFPNRKQTISEGVGTVTPSTGTTSQVFASYIYNVQYNWRGAPAAAIVPPKDPAFTYVPPVEVPQATANFSVNNPTLATFMSTKGVESATDPDRDRVIIDGQKVTFDITEDDFNPSQTGSDNKAGVFNGGGFKIEFAGLQIPAVEGVTAGEEYKAYKSIIITCTLAENNDPGSGWTGKQIIFSNTAGNGASANDAKNVAVDTGAYSSGSNSQYISIPGTDGVHTFKIRVDGLPASVTGIGVRANNYSSTNVPIQGDFTVTKIEFSIVE